MSGDAKIDVFVGLGSNLNDRRAAIERAIDGLDASEGIRAVRRSAIRETLPVGPIEQGPFLNAVVQLVVTVSPRAVLRRCLAIERSCGRDRRCEIRWGPRRIDLDLLLYGEATIDEPGLQVPHPRLHERAFVLEPLAEIAPSLVHPGYGVPVQTLLDRLRPPRNGNAAGESRVHLHDPAAVSGRDEAGR